MLWKSLILCWAVNIQGDVMLYKSKYYYQYL